jgi:hypothetical protein
VNGDRPELDPRRLESKFGWQPADLTIAFPNGERDDGYDVWLE